MLSIRYGTPEREFYFSIFRHVSLYFSIRILESEYIRTRVHVCIRGIYKFIYTYASPLMLPYRRAVLRTFNKDCAVNQRYQVIDIYKAELRTLFTVVSNEKEISTGAVNCFATNLSSIG